MAKKEAERRSPSGRSVEGHDAATDDSVEGHVNLQPQNAQEGPNKRAARTPRH